MKAEFEMPENISENAKDLLTQMLDYRNDERIAFNRVIEHPWFTKPEEVPINKDVMEKLQ